jgi:crotonobetainyl-CoA:carnitine CoA-transferase CaiB-like acyl-CoA transferase
VQIHSAPPPLGYHTDEVLRGLLGYDADRIAALRQRTVI